MIETPRPLVPARTSGLAIASLALGVIGFFAVPVIASIIAIVLGSQAQKEIARDPTVEGAGLARAGIILGWIGLVLGILGVLFGLAFLLAFF